MKRVLFVLKDRSNYGVSYGLVNSCRFIADALKKEGVETKVVSVIDNNAIDREVHRFKPTHAIVEALWVVPDKFKVLLPLHPSVNWTVRTHSKTSFIANEGIAIEWIKGYGEIQKLYPNFTTSANSIDFVQQTSHILGEHVDYLPNIYSGAPSKGRGKKPGNVIDIGCFGAVRPLKNHLLQAVVAMIFADQEGKKLRFHVNGRIEQKGDTVMKNLQNLFSGTQHELIVHEWMSHEEFLRVVKQMDIGMQVSFSETFNIVAADFAVNDVPVIGSDEIDWLSGLYRASLTDWQDVLSKLSFAYHCRPLGLHAFNKFGLNYHNWNAIKTWKNWLQK